MQLAFKMHTTNGNQIELKLSLEHDLANFTSDEATCTWASLTFYHWCVFERSFTAVMATQSQKFITLVIVTGHWSLTTGTL